jgi:hypothetical protein
MKAAFERIFEILHPLIMPFLDIESRQRLRICSRKLKEVVGYYIVEPEEVFNGNLFLFLHNYEVYRNRWVQFWTVADEFSEVTMASKLFVFVLNWRKEIDDNDNPILIAKAIVQWENEVPLPIPFRNHRIESRKRLQWSVKAFYVDLKKSIALYEFDSWNPPSVYRLHSDYEVVARWDDSMPSLVSIPVWKMNELGLSCKHRKRYLDHFLQMDRELQDIQESQVVHDIIDPNLNPRYFSHNARNAILIRIRERFSGEKMDRITFYNHRHYAMTWRYGRYGNHLNSITIPIREHYHWVPSDVEVLPSGKVVFLSPIHCVEDRFQRKTQHICAHIFQKMIPLFEQADIIKKQETTKLQVIVKVQR